MKISNLKALQIAEVTLELATLHEEAANDDLFAIIYCVQRRGGVFDFGIFGEYKLNPNAALAAALRLLRYVENEVKAMHAGHDVCV